MLYSDDKYDEYNGYYGDEWDWWDDSCILPEQELLIFEVEDYSYVDD